MQIRRVPDHRRVAGFEPFLQACRLHGAGVFCLVKTSNPGSADIQDLTLADGRPLWQQVAELVREWGEELVGENGLSAVGAVVGATHPGAVREARRRIDPSKPLNIPGLGPMHGLKTSVFLEVEGAAHYLPSYAGNLDIMTSAALACGDMMARRRMAAGVARGKQETVQ